MRPSAISVCGRKLLVYAALRECGPQRPLVLVMGGGDGMGKLKQCALSFVKLLARPQETPLASSEMQVVVVCGKNEPLQRALSAEIARAEGCNAARGPLGIRVLGFVANVADWMCASDILVTKAGYRALLEPY
jgi:UDP-N-acetylglucosamine:LPS N-acetylglucosamine transferase